MMEAVNDMTNGDQRSDKTYRVVQWAAGRMGKKAIRAVVDHPNLELVGLHVHSADKEGMDAGVLAGIGPIGILATRGIEDVVALGPDCVLYMQEGFDLDDLTRLLNSGINVVTTRNEFFYAAADAYVGPSLDDAFAQPPAEAMACGLPVITSRSNGGAEIIVHGENGFVLEDPTDSATLAGWLAQLLDDPGLCCRLGEAAAKTASALTWEQSARHMSELFERAARSRGVR